MVRHDHVNVKTDEQRSFGVAAEVTRLKSLPSSQKELEPPDVGGCFFDGLLGRGREVQSAQRQANRRPREDQPRGVHPVAQE